MFFFQSLSEHYKFVSIDTRVDTDIIYRKKTKYFVSIKIYTITNNRIHNIILL